jgi:hypothetical protein
MEERPLSTLDLAVLVLTLVSAAVGTGSMYWARAEPLSWRGRSGRAVFVLNLLVLGAAVIVAALVRAQGLAPLGLVAGLLIVGITWEGPPPSTRRPSPVPRDGQAS